jgi:hypothetical protein
MADGGMKRAVLKLASDYDKLASRAIVRTGGGGVKRVTRKP